MKKEQTSTYVLETSPKANTEKPTVKLTVGFKCSPDVKEQITKKAVSLGFTVSEYVEQIVVNALKGKENPTTESIIEDVQNEFKTVELSSDTLELIRLKLHEVLDEREVAERFLKEAKEIAATPIEAKPVFFTNEEVEELKARLAVYEENPKISALFEKYKGQDYTYTNVDDQEKTVQINSVSDVFSVCMDLISEQE